MMVDMAAIAGVTGALRSANDILKAVVHAHDITIVQGKIAELQREILSAQSSAFNAQSDQFALLQDKRDLEEKVASLETRATEKERYQLDQIAPGVFAYKLKPETKPIEPPHHICAECYNRGHKSILQQEARYPGRSTVMVCFGCGLEVYTSGARVTEFKPRGRPSGH